MTYPEIQQIGSQILTATLDNKLGRAFQLLAGLKNEAGGTDADQRFANLEETYRNMLRYSFEMAADPQRDKIFLDLQQSILALTDDLRDNYVNEHGNFDRKSYTHRIPHIETLVFSQSDQVIERLSLDDSSENNDMAEDTAGDLLASREELAKALFLFFWLKNRYKETELALFNRILDEEKVPVWVKSLSVSAVSLSLLRHFDSKKIILLFDLRDAEEPAIRQRALTGFFIGVLNYADRLALHSDILSRIDSVADDKQLRERLMDILLQLIRASETDKITKKIQEEIVPEVMKIRSELEDKLKLEDLLNKESFDDKNPEWENFFKDAPDVYQKLEQFSKMQVEGADVFMGAFAMLKHFPFFREMPNWFMPFNGKHSVVQQAFGMLTDEPTKAEDFISGLEESTVMCNSDKYSFCLNITHMPEQQRTMMLDLFNMEMKAMNEAMDDELKLNRETRNRIVNTQYIQDLYRFFKLHPGRREFPGIFNLPSDITENAVVKTIFNTDSLLRNLAEFYFARDNYSAAVNIFEALVEKDPSFELYEKTGFCYQKLQQYEKAIQMYKQAELFDRDKLWLQKKLGFCYRKTGQYEKAIAFYRQIITDEPRDLNNLAYLGQLHIDTGDFEEALKYYYRVEYEQPENTRVFRPIGWCSFVLGKYDTAIKYFSKVLEHKPNKSDYLNLGHSFWAGGQLGKALDTYREAVKQSGGDEKWFRAAFEKDGIHLKKKGIDDLEIMLMIDYILIG